MSPLSRRSLLKHLFKMSAAGLFVPSATRYFFIGDPVRRVLTQGLTPALVEVPFNDYAGFLQTGVTFGIELDPIGNPGAITVIADLDGSNPRDQQMIRNILGSESCTFSVNYIFDDKGGKVRR